MVVDIGEVKRHIEPKADSTLFNMRKADLIEYVRTLEHNYNVAVSFNENQAKYMESLGQGCATRGKDGKGMGRDFAIEILKAHACCSVTELHCDCDCPLWDKEKGCCRAWTDEEVREAVHLLNGERRSP